MIGFGGFGIFFRVFGGVWGGLGGSRWVKVCLLDFYRMLFAPLEVLYGTRFGSKHHMMVQLAHIRKVGITDPFSSPLEPPQGFPKGHYMSK